MQEKQKRIFLGWSEPLPKLAVARFFSRIGDRNPADFGDFLILVPTAEAGRLLREAVAEARSGTGGITGLDIRMPDQLFSDIPAAPAAEVLAAWHRVLKNVPAEDFKALFGDDFDAARKDAARLLNIGSLIQNCRRTLAEDGVPLAAAAEKIRISAFAEQTERFRLLTELEKAFLAVCPDDPVRRMLSAVPSPGDRRTVIVLHCPDLRGAAARFLDRWPGEVEYWINAPADTQDRFDRQGRALPVWRTVPFEIDTARQLRIVSDARAQVKLLETLREQGLPCRAVGVPDAKIAEAWCDQLRCMTGETMPVFFPFMRPLAAMPWTGLFLRLLDLSEEKDPPWSVVAALLRNGFFVDQEALEQFDRLQADSLAQTLNALCAAAHGRRYADIHSLLARLMNWHDRIRRSGGRKLTVCWNILGELGKTRLSDHAREELVALESLITAAEKAAENDGELAAALVRAMIAEARLSPVPRGTEKLDAVGFLELPWYGDSVVIAAGLSENAMSNGKLSDIFLPEQLKRHLGLRTIADRQAADAACFFALDHSADVYFLVVRSDASGNRLLPPRILLQCGRDKLPGRIDELFGKSLMIRTVERKASEHRNEKMTPCRDASFPKGISVTDFALYLNGPFNFYEQKLRGVESVPERSMELDAMQLGTLIHAAVAECADGLKNGVGEKELAAAAAGNLRRLAGKYGDPLPGLVRLQLEITEQSLQYFAKEQSAWQQKGWRAIRLETANSNETAVDGTWGDFYRAVFPGEPVEAWRDEIGFKGRYDRLDARTLPDGRRELCVIDYKTGKAESPEQTHICKAEKIPVPDRRFRQVGTNAAYCWRNLQLPLYVLMIKYIQREPADLVRAAYFNLPAALTETGIRELPDLDNEEILFSAMRCADWTVKRIFGPDPVFWPPGELKYLYEPYWAPRAEDFDAENFFIARKGEKA